MNLSTISLNKGPCALLCCMFLIAAMTLPSAAAAQRWKVVAAQSKIGFEGTHAGRAFAGVFNSWTADIRFDPADLASSKAVVLVDLASATTGDQTYDKTLPTADWFDIAKFSEGRFETTGITANADGSFVADGSLTLRGVSVPVTLEFTFEPDGDTALLQGTASLQRLDFGIGKSSDAPGDWVSLDIPVVVEAVMEREK